MKKNLLLLALVLSNLTIGYSQTWSQLVSPTTLDIVSCSFVNENVGWMVSQNSIYKTLDGGTSWIEQNAPSSPVNDIVTFNKIHFIDATNGIIACSNLLSAGYDPTHVSSVLWTTNGGETWVFKDLGNGTTFINDARLVNANTAFTIGNGGHGRKTVDAGATWTTFNYPTSPNSTASSIAAINENIVYFAGVEAGFFHYGSFGKTIDAGENWIVSNVSGNNMRTLYFTDALNGWIGGNGGVIKQTTDGGDFWSTSNTNVDSAITDIAFTNSLDGWAVTDDAKIIHSTDGGVNWSLAYTATMPIRSVSFANGIGFAVGDAGTLLKYSSTLGLPDTASTTGFSFYPNPTDNIINVLLDNVGQGSNTINIYNALGQIVKKVENITSQTTIINRENMPAGIYFIQLNQDNKKLASSKLVVK